MGACGYKHHLRCELEQGLQRRGSILPGEKVVAPNAGQEFPGDAGFCERGRVRSAVHPLRVRDGPVHEHGAVVDEQHGLDVVLVHIAMWPAVVAELAVVFAVCNNLHC